VSSPAGLEPPPVEPAPPGVAWPDLTSEGEPAVPASGPILPRPGTGAKLVIALGVVFTLVALIAKGGLSLGPMTLVEIAVTVLGAGVAAAAALAAPTPARNWGGFTMFAVAALTVWTALSVIWSVVPDASWNDANRAIAYLFAFAGGIALARLFPWRAGSIVGGVLLSASAISIIALALKSFPVVFNSTEELARMRAPLDYWNALGLIAAFAIPPALWLGARREGPPSLRALAWPLLGLAGIVVALTYSRGVLIALVVALAFWFAFVPLRLRGLAVLLGAGAAATAISVWAFADDALSKDRAPLSDRVTSGEHLALLCIAMVIVLFAVGLAVNRYTDRQPLSDRWRERVGLGALGVGVGVLVALAVGLSLTGGGPGARIDRAWNNFFSTNKASTTYGPSRLKSIGTRRGSYWRDAYSVWTHHRVLGVGANGYVVARKRYRKDPVEVTHAHGYVPQTAADLGLIGLGLSLLAFIAWIVAAARTSGSRRRVTLASLDPRRWPAAFGRLGNRLGKVPEALGRAPAAFSARADRAAVRRPIDGDKAALLTLVTVVIMFGAHSLIDWTWFVPGTAVVALVCAGFVAGRGPRGVPGPEQTRPFGNRMTTAVALVALALVAVWAIWQPLRADKASDAALASLEAGQPKDALVQAEEAHKRNPLALQPLFDISTVQDALTRRDLAQKALEEAVRLQPANPAAWTQLATYQLNVLQQATPAFQSARAALFLDPKSPAAQALFLDAYRRLPRQPVNPASAGTPGTQRPNAGKVLGALEKLGSKQGNGK
jgi:tetratricopeptide (TPR) repeat protein